MTAAVGTGKIRRVAGETQDLPLFSAPRPRSDWTPPAVDKSQDELCTRCFRIGHATKSCSWNCAAPCPGCGLAIGLPNGSDRCWFCATGRVRSVPLERVVGEEWVG